MKVITSRFWSKCEAPHCILLTNTKAVGDYAYWYLCPEHCTEKRVEELDTWFRAG